MRFLRVGLPVWLLLLTGWVHLGLAAEDTPKKDATVDYPQAAIASTLLKATLYLPDAEKGFYRGTRFDWSGVISQIEYKGHTYFATFGSPHNPKIHDHIAGPAEEFSMDDPPGYAEAKEGETFVKIGVGLLKRGKEKKYGFSGNYAVEKFLPWDVSKTGNSITFTQTLEPTGGWGYVYTKKVYLAKELPVLVIGHMLENTGTRAIATDHYNHNFLIFDQEPISSAYRIVYPFTPEVEKVNGKQSKLDGNTLAIVTDTFTGSLWMQLKGFTGKEDHVCIVENTKTRTSVKIRSDLAPVKYRVYAEKTALCPEAFVPIQVEPGRSQLWTNTYEFVAP